MKYQSHYSRIGTPRRFWDVSNLDKGDRQSLVSQSDVGRIGLQELGCGAISSEG